MTLSYQDALPYVAYTVDDALSERPFNPKDPTLVGFEAGHEPLFVAVVSCLPGCHVDAEEATEIAIDLLLEKGWFADETHPFIVLEPEPAQ